MITGINTSHVHDGKPYHIQCEDLGRESGKIEIRVYREGIILWQKRLPYAGADEEAIRQQMAKLTKTVKAAIGQGKIS